MSQKESHTFIQSLNFNARQLEATLKMIDQEECDYIDDLQNNLDGIKEWKLPAQVKDKIIEALLKRAEVVSEDNNEDETSSFLKNKAGLNADQIQTIKSYMEEEMMDAYKEFQDNTKLIDLIQGLDESGKKKFKDALQLLADPQSSTPTPVSSQQEEVKVSSKAQSPKKSGKKPKNSDSDEKEEEQEEIKEEEIENISSEDQEIGVSNKGEDDPEHFYNDYKDIPESAEKTVQLIRYKVGILLEQRNDPFNINILERLEILKIQLEKEQLYKTEAETLYQMCLTQAKNQQWEDFNKNIFKLSKIVNNIDINRLIRYIKLNINASDSVKNQNIILLLGDTGTGKSTTIHFLAGSEMRVVNRDGLINIEPLKVINQSEGIKKVRCSPHAKSETRYITPIPINLKEIGVAYKAEKSIVLCDTPGFKDQNGCEVDIANGYGIVKALKGCNSVRPVILISSQSFGSRCAGIKELAHLLSRMIDEIGSYLNSFTYLFTKFNDQKEIKSLNKTFQNVKDNLNEEETNDEGFLAILDDLIEQTSINILAINPTKTKASPVMKAILTKSAIDSMGIFHFSISQSSRDQLIQQSTKHQQAVNVALKNKDYELIKYKLDQLLFLNECLDFKDIKSRYSEIVDSIVKYVNNDYQDQKDRLNKCFQNMNLLTEQDLEVYYNAMHEAEGLDLLRDNHLKGQQFFDSSSFEQNLVTQAAQITEQVVEAKQVDSQLVINNLEKINLLSTWKLKKSKDLEKNYETVQNHLKSKYQKIFQVYQEELLKINYEVCAQEYQNLIQILNTVAFHFISSQESIQLEKDNLKIHAQQNIKDQASSIQELMQLRKWKNDEINAISQVLKTFSRAQESFEFERIITREFLKTINDEFIQQIVQKIAEKVTEIQDQLNSEDDKDINFSHIETVLKEIVDIRKIDQAKEKTDSLFMGIIGDVSDKISTLANQAENMLRSILQAKQDANYKKLKLYLDYLSQTEFITQYKSNAYLQVIDKIVTQIKDHFEEIMGGIREKLMDLEYGDNIVHCHRVILKIREMLIFNQVMKDITVLIEDANKEYESNLEKLLNDYDTSFSSVPKEESKTQQAPVLDFSKAVRALAFFKVCEDKKIPAKNYKDIKTKLITLTDEVGSYSQVVLQNINAFINTLEVFDENANKELHLIIQSIEKSLQMFKYSSTQQPEFFEKYLAEHYDQFINKFLRIKIDLEDSFEQDVQNHQNKRVLVKIQLIRNLQQLDRHLNKFSFQELISKFGKEFKEQLSAEELSVKEQLKAKNYIDLHKLLKEKADSTNPLVKNSFNSCLGTLKMHLEDLTQKIRRESQTIQTGDYKQDNVNDLHDHIRSLPDFKHPINEFIDQYNETKDFKEHSINSIKPRIAQGIEELMRRAQKEFKQFQYQKGDKILAFIAQTCDTLKQCDVNISNDESYQKFKSELDEIKIQQLNKKIDYYQQMKIDEYFIQNPKEFLSRFDENAQLQYQEQINSINNVLRQNLEKAIGEYQDRKSKRERKLYEDFLKDIFQFVPDAIERGLLNKLREIINIVEEMDEKYSACLKQAIEKNDMDELSNLYNIFLEKGATTYIDEIKDKFEKNCNFLKEETFRSIKDSDNVKVVQNFAELVKIKDKQKKFYSIIGPYYDQVESKIQEQIHQSITDLKYTFKYEQLLQINDLDKLEQIHTKKLEKAFDFLVQLVEDKNEAVKIAVGNDLNAKFSKDVVDFIKINIQQAEDEFNQSINKEEYEIVTKLVVIFSQWDKLFEFINKNWERDPKNSVTKIQEFVKKAPNSQKLLEKVQVKVNTYKQIVIEVNFETDVAGYALDNERKQYFENIQQLKSSSSKFKPLRRIIKDVDKIEAEVKTHFIQEKEKIFNIANKIITSQVIGDAEYKEFNSLFKQLQFFNTYFTQEADKQKVDKLENEVKTKYEKYVVQSQSLVEPGPFAQNLIQVKLIAQNIPSFSERIDTIINDLLVKFKNNGGKVQMLGPVLDNETSGIGKLITSEYKIFSGYMIKLKNQKIKRKGIDEVLSSLSGDKIDPESLKGAYETCQALFDTLLQKYIAVCTTFLQTDKNIKECINKTLLLIVSDTKNQIKMPKVDKDGKLKITGELQKTIIKQMSYIFVFWTLSTSEHYFENMMDQDGESASYLMQPHAAQILSIIRILGVGDKPLKIESNLVQIGTGEGKSITLGVTSTILSLLGFEVSCACYSQYLSTRDYESFKNIFNMFGVIDMVQYGTFNQLCERQLNKDQNIRDAVSGLVLKQFKGQTQAKQIERPQILLIDEVDVFFSSDFFGQMFTPSASIRGPQVKTLIDFIWSKRSSKISLNDLKNSQQFKDCAALFKDKFIFLLEEACKDLICDSRDFEHDYVILQNTYIGYKQQDEISTKISFGYKTMYAYYKEIGQGKINPSQLEQNVFIKISCGQFSYAEIPLRFNYILGVTGTLDALIPIEREIAIEKKYGIRKFTYAPSVFGKSNLTFNPMTDVQVFEVSEHYNEIKREIQNKLSGRAILIFFEDNEQLTKFQKSEHFQMYRDKSMYLTEKATYSEKDHIVKNATNIEQITLLTSSFGRGTDFILRDDIVIQNRGIHVIQAYPSEQKSEEAQVKGRAARQGDQGSYSLIVNLNQIEKFQITEHDLLQNSGKGNTNRYKYIAEKRTKYQTLEFLNRIQNIERTEEDHKLGIKFLKDLSDHNEIECIKYLQSFNQGQVLTEASKTLILMDATGSMSSLLKGCKDTINVMFQRATQVMEENKVQENAIQLQFAVYRNYGCQEVYLLENSSWESKATNLKTFLEQVQARGGQGNEAIEVGFQYANQEHQRQAISQVILIGDAAANTDSEVVQKRNGAGGESYWANTKFAQKTTYKQEIEKFQQNGIKVYSFYVASYAQSNFQEIASYTGGKCQSLDIYSSQGAETLTNLVTTTILADVSEKNGMGDKLVKSYMQKFSFHS